MRIGVDIGGTFTDFVVVEEDGSDLRTLKLLSTPRDPAEAVLEGLRRLADETSGRPAADALRALRASIVHGSTVATNAVLERKGARTALVTTRGFRDVLRIGRQARPELYDFFADPPAPLVPPELSFEVTERVDPRGAVLRPLEESELDEVAGSLEAAGVEAVAVSLLFSFLRPEHEGRVRERLRMAGLFVSLSSEVLPEFREYERASTTALDAYVTPVLDRYLGRLSAELEVADLRIMQSNGGSARAEEARRHGVRSILSGPAGGVVGALHVARAAGFSGAITFDMGGTSTDVSLAREEPRLTAEAEIGGLPLRVPVVDLHTVGSGGGSIARVDPGGALRVGPESAGADPGPACYGRGGEEATVTDAHLVLGRLPADRFLGGRMPLDVAAAEAALERLAARAHLRGSGGLSAAQRAALGVVRVADAHMERALRVISVERGHDPEDFVLVSFGGAGGLHACPLARRLGIQRVLAPAGASTLSAYGMLAAPVTRDDVLTVMLPGDTPFPELERRIGPLGERALGAVLEEGVPEEAVAVHREVEVRYVGQSYELPVPLAPDFVRRFHEEHRRRYGHSEPGAPVEAVSLRVRAVGGVSPPPLPGAAPGPASPARAMLERRLVVLGGGGGGPGGGPGGRGGGRGGGRSPRSGTRRAGGEEEAAAAEVPFYEGSLLRAGNRVEGPAVVVQPDTTVFLPAGCEATVDGHRNLLIAVGG